METTMIERLSALGKKVTTLSRNGETGVKWRDRDRGQVEDFSIADAGDAGYVGTYGTSITG